MCIFCFSHDIISHFCVKEIRRLFMVYYENSAVLTKTLERRMKDSEIQACETTTKHLSRALDKYLGLG